MMHEIILKCCIERTPVNLLLINNELYTLILLTLYKKINIKFTFVCGRLLHGKQSFLWVHCSFLLYIHQHQFHQLELTASGQN